MPGTLVFGAAALASPIERTYASVAQSLIRKFRIFTASNALAFALLGLVTLRRKAEGLQLALLGAVAAMLADVAFNRARVTTGILKAALQVIGSAIRAAPC